MRRPDDWHDKPSMHSDTEERSRSAIFIALLIDDVIAARSRLAIADTQTARRDIVRASLATMEGLAWIMRQHVAAALAGLDALTPMAELALSETAYSVTTDGQVVEQPRGLPLPTAIRLAVSQARIISPEIEIDFSEAGWSRVRHAVTIRNRITHPKPGNDLTITDDDLNVVASGLLWLLATNEYVMASTNLALVQHNKDIRELVDRLRAGDPDALAAYHAVLDDSD